MEGTLKASTMGTCGCPGTPSVDHLGKNIQNLSGTLFAFEIFEIAQKSKKVSSLELPTRQLPEVSVSAQACPMWVS